MTVGPFISADKTNHRAHYRQRCHRILGLQTEPRFTTLELRCLSLSSHTGIQFAGDVPDELFVGRTEIVNKIISPGAASSCTAVDSWASQHCYTELNGISNRLDNKLAIYIDFKVERIGEENEPEYLWTVLRNRLHEVQKVLPQQLRQRSQTR